MNDIAALYSGPQHGGELPYFVGKQYGSGWLRTIGRFALPILKRIGNTFMGTAHDILTKNSKFLPALKERALSNAIGVVPELLNTVVPRNTSSVPVKRKKTAKKSINKRIRGRGTIFDK